MQAELDSDIYNPEYNARIEYRDPVFPPSCTLMLKLYTVDKVSKNLCCVGYGFLPIFIEVGTTTQPSVSKSEVKVGLDFYLPFWKLYIVQRNWQRCLCSEYHSQVRPSLHSQLRLTKFAFFFFSFLFFIVLLLTSAIDVSDEIIAKLSTIDATRESRMSMQNIRIGRKISRKFEAEKADLLTKNDHTNTQKN